MDSFSLLTRQVPVVGWLYFLCTMILSEHLAKVMDHFSSSRFVVNFDMINHDNRFSISERYVKMGGSALQLIRSYFKLMALCLILLSTLVCCVGCQRAQFLDQLNFICIGFHLVRYLS